MVMMMMMGGQSVLRERSKIDPTLDRKFKNLTTAIKVGELEFFEQNRRLQYGTYI